MYHLLLSVGLDIAEGQQKQLTLRSTQGAVCLATELELCEWADVAL